MAYPQYQPQYQPQPCDGYLEHYDRQLQICPKEHAKLVARERQYAIADEMSKAVSDEYQEDIVGHMLAMDSATLPDVDSIDIQTEIKWFMRPYLLDFLVEAHSAFQLLPTTLFLTVNLLDRYCSKRVVYKRHYQLVGCAALLIAAKYGDKKDRVPTIKELKSMCCSLYDEDMFVQMEWHVLQTLGWCVGHPTVDAFLQVAVTGLAYDAELEHLTLYILEIALFQRDFVSKLSSDLARAALALSRLILGRAPAQPSHWAASYDTLTLISLSQNLPPPSQVLARKYSSSHYSRVSKVMENFLQRQMAMTKPCNPPTPPADRVESKPYQGEPGLATPQKQAYPSVHGYITPPITPEIDVFATTAQQQASRHNASVSQNCRPASTAVPVQYGQPQNCMVQEHGLYSQPQQHYQVPSSSAHPYNSGL